MAANSRHLKVSFARPEYYIAKIENGKQTGPVELAVEFAEFFEVSLDYLLVGKGDFAEEQKRGLRMAISFLSELEASL